MWKMSNITKPGERERERERERGCEKRGNGGFERGEKGQERVRGVRERLEPCPLPSPNPNPNPNPNPRHIRTRARSERSSPRSASALGAAVWAVWGAVWGAEQEALHHTPCCLHRCRSDWGTLSPRRKRGEPPHRSVCSVRRSAPAEGAGW